MQGHDIAAIAMITPSHSSSNADAPVDTPALDNDAVIAKHVAISPGSIPPRIFKLPALGPKPENIQPRSATESSVEDRIDDELELWLSSAAEALRAMYTHLRTGHDRRAARLAAIPAAARSTIWWPFTQHKGMTDGSITVIDARVGESYSVVRGHGDTSSAPTPADLSIVREYDGCASWWTQGTHMSPTLRPGAWHAALPSAQRMSSPQELQWRSKCMQA